MSKQDDYLGTIDRLEPNIHPIDAGAGWASLAISAKRIADILESFAVEANTPDRFEERAKDILTDPTPVPHDLVPGPLAPIGSTPMKYPVVGVVGGDYAYAGHLMSVFHKLGSAVRCVVEDKNGRLFIHNSKQLGMSDSELLELGVKFHLIVA